MALGARRGRGSACERRAGVRVARASGECGMRTARVAWERRVWRARAARVACGRRAGAHVVAGVMRALRTLKRSIKKWRVKWSTLMQMRRVLGKN